MQYRTHRLVLSWSGIQSDDQLAEYARVASGQLATMVGTAVRSELNPPTARDTVVDPNVPQWLRSLCAGVHRALHWLRSLADETLP